MTYKKLCVYMYSFSVFITPNYAHALPVVDPATTSAVVALDVALGITQAAQNALITTTNAQLTTANTSLQRIAASTQIIATDTTNIVRIYQSPSVVAAAFLPLEGGGLAEANGDILQYVPDLAGQTATKPTSRILDTAITAGVTADETLGIATGNPAGLLLSRMQNIGANIQGEVQDDLILQAKRYDAANALIARLTPLDIKQTIAYGVAAQLETIKSLSLLAQTMSYNTAAVSETFLTRVRSSLRRSMDHMRSALLF